MPALSVWRERHSAAKFSGLCLISHTRARESCIVAPQNSLLTIFLDHLWGALS